jgi:GNAT superfamily N-acetyltransferase
MKLEVHPASIDRFSDVAAVLRPKNDSSQACWCLAYRLSSAENNALSGKARPERLRSFCDNNQAPGVLAYVDGIPAGWCAVSPRTDFVRLVRSKTIQALDSVPVWSIVCLVVKAGFRGAGLSAALIEGAAKFAAASGATCLEAYPIETEGQKVSSSLAYTGTRSMFERSGFMFCAETSAKSAGKPRVIMRRNIGLATAGSASGA